MCQLGVDFQHPVEVPADVALEEAQIVEVVLLRAHDDAHQLSE